VTYTQDEAPQDIHSMYGPVTIRPAREVSRSTPKGNVLYRWDPLEIFVDASGRAEILKQEVTLTEIDVLERNAKQLLA
jgi:hypothetical protein